MIDTRQIHSMSDFVRNPKAHVARLKETKTPEVLTVNGRAEVVVMDTETYEDLIEQIEHMKAVATVRAIVQKANSSGQHEEISEAEIERRQAVMRELVEETERLGLYR